MPMVRIENIVLQIVCAVFSIHLLMRLAHIFDTFMKVLIINETYE